MDMFMFTSFIKDKWLHMIGHSLMPQQRVRDPNMQPAAKSHIEAVELLTEKLMKNITTRSLIGLKY